MAGLYVGALVVALLQYLRFRERRLLALMALLTLLAMAHLRGLSWAWANALHIGAGIAALALVFVLSPRASRHP